MANNIKPQRKTKYFLSNTYSSETADAYRKAMNEAIIIRDGFLTETEVTEIIDEKLDFQVSPGVHGIYFITALITFSYY